MWDGKLLFALIAAVVLSAVAGRLVAAVYRRRVLALMRQAPVPADAAVPAPLPLPLPRRPEASGIEPNLAQNRAARRRLTFAFVALCLAIALFQAWWNLAFVHAEGGYGPVKLLLMTMVFGWLVVPAYGLLRRWSWWRTALTSIAYMAVVGVLVWLRSNEAQQISGVAAWLASTLAPVLIALGLAASGRARAAGPYLLPLFLLLVGASVLGTDLLARLSPPTDPAPWLYPLLGTLGAYGTIAAFALAPWLLMAWPAWRAARGLARAYEARRFSEPVYMLSGYWLVALLIDALSASHGVGAASLFVLAGWLAIPLWVTLMRGLLPIPQDPPSLLVLRVFRRDEDVQALFDSVVDRWRYSGRTSLIAGTDLALTTLEPDELFAFMNGRLRERFIDSEAELRTQLAAMDLPADADGRFRVTEFYCFDRTWQLALATLVARSNVVLMDLRGFTAANAGCLHELGVLSRAAHLRRIVVLFDARTDRGAAEKPIGTASGRFFWFDASRIGSRDPDAVLAKLLEAGG